MVSLHFFNIFYMVLEHLPYYSVFFFFVTVGFSILLFSTLSIKKLFYNTSIIYNLFILFVIGFVLLFLILFYLKYYYYYFNYNSQFFSNSIFSETLIILATFISVISWFFLSERYMFKNIFFIFYFFIFIANTINMVITNNLLVMFIFFEFIFLPSLFFVYQFGYSKKVEKTILYLLTWTLTGSLLVLVGLVYLYAYYKSLTFNTLMYLNFTFFEKILLFFVFFFGFGIKIPIWPFHYWLTKVHVEAPTGFSIFLSGFLVKTAFFCFIMFYSLFNTVFLNYITLMFILWGALDASLRMWTSNDIKKLIAFATIQEMNLIMLLFLFSKNINYTFTNIFLLVHGVLSGFLFYLVDQVQKQTSTRNLIMLSGLSVNAPTLHFFIWFGILIFRGFPIFIKFFIEWEILSILLLNLNFIGVCYFFLINVIGVLGFSRIWFTILYGQPNFKIARSNILRKDTITGFIFTVSLLFFNFFIFLFYG